MMTSSISAFALCIILVVLFVFRKTVKVVTREAPEMANTVVTHLTDTIRVNVLEDKLEQQDTLQNIQNRMQNRQWISAKTLMSQMENYETAAQNPQPQPATSQPAASK